MILARTQKTPIASAAHNVHGALEQLLLAQLKEQPGALPARMQLLELYFETHRRDDFLRQANQLYSQLRERAPASSDWQKCVSMGRMLSPDVALFRESGDRIAFIDPALAGSQVGAREERRFGRDPRQEQLFQNFAEECAPLLRDPTFIAELDHELLNVARRPSSLLHLRRLSQQLGGAQVFLKREDHSPANTHLTIAVVGLALAAKRLKRRALVAGTIDGRRGVIASLVAARQGLESIVYMDAENVHRHSGNVFQMWMMNAHLQTVDSSVYRNGDIREAALEHWSRNMRDCVPVVGLDAAPEPFPSLTRECIAVIGRETRRQVMAVTRRQPDLLVARGGHTSDAIGFFTPFVRDGTTRLACVSSDGKAAITAAGKSDTGFDPSRQRLTAGEQAKAKTILEGLEYPSVIREHQWLRASGRVESVVVTQEIAKGAIRELSHAEGLIPSLDTAHALGWALHQARTMRPDQSVVVMFAEDSAKDLWDLSRLMGVPS